VVGARAAELEGQRRLERGLVWVRWLGVILGAYLITQTNTGPVRYFPRAPERNLELGFGLLTLLALVNVLVWRGTSGAPEPHRLRRLGFLAFATDIVVILGLAWVYSYDAKTTVWVVIYILPLEGALRYQLRGALAVLGITLVSEIGREALLDATSPGYMFQVSNVAFRVGILALIALVGGFMARSLAREADNAARQAARFQEAARRESLARRELAAFNTAILTGMAASEDPDRSIRQMAVAVARDLGYETFTILLREGDRLVVKGISGMGTFDRPVPIGEGVTGTVAATGRAMLVPDVREFPAYVAVDGESRSEMAAPLRIGDEVIGVINVESRATDAFDEPALGVLTRLADQIALVVQSARLLATQREAVARLQELDQMKSDFVAIASHELRTPLTAIHGYVRTLVRRFDSLSPQDVQMFLATIARQSERMTRLVEDLLVVSRIEAGAIRLQPEPVHLLAFLEGTLESLGPEERMRVRLHVEHGARTVALDPDRVDQVLRNLVGNALKFSPPEAPIDLTATVQDGRIEFAVADRGIGIAPQELPHLFERFRQAGSVLTRSAEGAGLGLYITKRLVDAMGGSIEVDSEVGRGSTFRVGLPVGGADRPGGAAPHPAGTAMQDSGGAGTAMAGSGTAEPVLEEVAPPQRG
jgi:signal transduction histidine kinase